MNGPRHNFPKSTRKHRLASGGVSRRESNRTKATNKILYAHWRLEEEAIRQAAERRKATAEKQRRRERCRAREAEREKKGGVEVGEAKKKSLKTPSAQAVEAKGEEVKRGEQERVRQSVGDCREEERRPFQMHAGGFSTPSCHCLLKQVRRWF